MTTAIISSSLVHELVEFENFVPSKIISLKQFLCGGNTLSPILIQKLSKQLGCSVSQGYGMTETGTISLFSLTDKSSKHKLLSSGKPVPGVTLKIVHPKTGKELKCNQQGEICVKSSSMFKEFLNLNSSNLFDSDGFYKTGDLGYYDEDNCVYILGRLKEIFKFQEWHIVPAMLEHILLEHPDIIDAGVFGVSAGPDGEQAAACIVVKPDSKISKSDIDELVNPKVTDKERLRGGVWILESLPRTATGKLLRKKLDMVSETGTKL